MGISKGAAIAVVLLVAATIVMVWFMLPYILPEPAPPPPVCEYDIVYGSQDLCSCFTGDHKWTEAETGWLCVPVDLSLPNCHRYPYLTTTECECPPPRVWLKGEGDPVTWSCLD